MDVEAEIARARAAEPAWDELRERRVLARIASERAARARRQERVRLAGAALTGLAVAAAVALVWRAATTSEAPVVARETEAGGSLVLSDGSEVRLETGARVEIVAQSATELRLAQRAGVASYDVSHRPERAFVVAVDDVEVRVRGTRFSVRVDGPWAEVEVREGRVEVAGGGEVRALGAGEALRVQRHSEVVSARVEEPSREATPGDAREEPASVDVAALAPLPEATATSEVEVVRDPARREGARRAPSSLDELLAEADAARRDGRLDDAASVLQRAAREHARDRRAATALFTLARVERTRGRAAAAARAFEDAYARDPEAVLAEDALAEAASAWQAAGDHERASSAAERYLERYPDGEYDARVRALQAP